MIDTFCSNGKVGDIAMKDKSIEVKLIFPNTEQMEEELAYLYPIKRGGLSTIRIFPAVNKGYVPGRRRAETDEVGTPLLPGIGNKETCHGCGKMIDIVKDVFYVNNESGTEKYLCDVCYMVPQPETIDTPAAVVREGMPTHADCRNFKPPEEEDGEGPCMVHKGDPLDAYRKPGDPACENFVPKDPPSLEDTAAAVASGEAEPGPAMTDEEIAQVRPGEVVDLGTAGEQERACRQCAHPRGLTFMKAGGKRAKSWKSEQKDDGSWVDICPACGAENVFPDEDEDGKAAGGKA